MPTNRIRASAIQLWHGVEARASVAMMLYAGVAFASSVMAVALWERTPLGSALEELLTGAQALLVHAAPAAPPAPPRTLLGTGAGLVVGLPGLAGAATRLPASAPGGALREPEGRVDGRQMVEEAPRASELDEPTVSPADVPGESGDGGHGTATTVTVAETAAAHTPVPTAAPTAVRTRAPTTVPTSGTPSVPAATRVPVPTVAESTEPAAAAPALIFGQGALGASEATARASPMAEPARQEEETAPFEWPTSRARLTREERALLRGDAQEPPEDHKVAKAGRGSGESDAKEQRSVHGSSEVMARRDTALDSARENARNGGTHVAPASAPAPLPVAMPAATPSPVPEPGRAAATERAQTSSAPVHITPPAGTTGDRGDARGGVGPGSAASTGKAKEADQAVSPPQAVESMGSMRRASEPSDARSAATTARTSTAQDGKREAISARATR